MVTCRPKKRRQQLFRLATVSTGQTPRLVDDPIDISAPTHFPIKRIAIAAHYFAL